MNPSKDSLAKAREIVYGDHWNDDRILVERIASALDGAYKHVETRTTGNASDTPFAKDPELLVEALEFYQANGAAMASGECIADGGEMARTALAKWKGE
jgi:hypothetical protein